MSEKQNITDEVMIYAYKHLDKKEFKRGENKFFEKLNQNHDQFIDWVIYDYVVKDGKTFAQLYLEEKTNTLKQKEREYIEDGIHSYLGVYQAIKEPQDTLIFKNVFTQEEHVIQKDSLEEEVLLHDIVIGRMGKNQEKEFFSSRIIILPYQYKTLLVGQILESFEEKKAKRNFLTYKEYFKENVPEVLKIINKLLPKENRSEKFDLYQSNYAVLDFNKIRGILMMQENIFFEEEEGKLFASLYDDSKKDILAEFVVGKDRLEVECNNMEDRILAKKQLESLLKDCIVHTKDEILTIDDII